MTTHPQVPMVPPGEDEPAGIDTLMVPLITALWEAGYITITCCQDLGESIGPLNRRKAAYWKGWVLLELPATGAKALMELAAGFGRFPMHWADDDAWDVSVPVIMLGPSAILPGIVQVHFPQVQLERLTGLVKARGAQFLQGQDQR
jgi:hypothetical protein